MECRVYSPSVVRTTIVDSYNNLAGLTFTGTAAIAYFGGRYFAAIEGSTGGLSEGTNDNTIPGAGQRIWMVTCDSEDVNNPAHWSTPFKALADSAYCTNPISTPGHAADFQPCFTVVGDELWCLSMSGNSFVHLSKLTDPHGKWTNYRLVFDVNNDYAPSFTLDDLTTEGPNADGLTPWPRFEDGAQCTPMSASDGVILATGMIVLPVSFSSDNFTATPGIVSSFTRRIKYNGILKSSDGGATWSLTRIDTSLFGDFCAWEPFVVEDIGGYVYVYSRNLNMSGTAYDMVLVAVSSDGCETFTTSVSAKLPVPNSRGVAKRLGSHLHMLMHADSIVHSSGQIEQNNVFTRRNVSPFLSIRGISDLVPGPNISGDDLFTNYPQFCIAGNGDIIAIYTAGIGGQGVRASLKIARFAAPPQGYALVLPRSNARFDPGVPVDAELIAGTPPYYQFISESTIISTTTVTASTGVTYAAWVDFGADSDAIMDARTSGGAFTPTSFGQLLQRNGLSISGLNFFHGVTLSPGPRIFIAAIVDNTTQTVKVYVAKGESDFTTVTGYYHSVLFSGLPADGDTITINSVVYTFRTAPSLTNDVAIGSTVTASTANLSTKVRTNSMQAGDLSPRIILARTDIATFTVSSGSAHITVETSMPLNGGQVHFGRKAFASSSLGGWAGRMYDARVYASALSVANLRSLYNNLADDFTYTAIAGTSTAPGTPLIFLDPNNPDSDEFPSIGVAPYYEMIDDTLILHGEASASELLPHGATRVNLRFKLDAAPTGDSRYVIATMGDGSGPSRLFIDADNPTKLYLESKLIATLDPTVWNTVTMIVSPRKVTIGSIERVAAGEPRLFLGNAYPQGLLASDKTVTFDVSVMRADRA